MEIKNGTGILDHIQRLSREDPYGHDKCLKKLKLEYNQAMVLEYNDRSDASYDITEILPPELWIQIIQNSLPRYNYSSALLIFTLVSNKWRNAITSMPVLWAHLEIRQSAEDSLAVFETFRQLSCDTPLLLTIYSPVGAHWTNFGSILSSIGSRLRKVKITYEKDPRSMTQPSRNVGLALEMLLREFSQHITGVVEIDVYHQYAIATNISDVSPKLRWFNLPQGIRTIKGWYFQPQDLPAVREVAQGFHEISSCLPIDIIVPIFGNHSLIQSITSTMVDLSQPPYAIGTNPKDYRNLSNLRRLSYKNAYRTMLLDLMRAVGPNLVELDLRIPFPKVTELYLNLDKMHRLQSLDLNIVKWNSSDEQDGAIKHILTHPKPASKVPSLRSLALSTRDRFSEDGDISSQLGILHSLITTFSSLYQTVSYASFYITLSDIISHLLDYIAELPMLKVLNMDGEQETLLSNQTITSSSLENLDIGHHIFLDNLQFPNRLLSLKIAWGDYCRKGKLVSLPDLVKLFITVVDDGDAELPTTSFPSLRHLSISFLDGVRKFHLMSFPFITSLSIYANQDGLLATALCFELLCQPDTCPSLNEIRLLNCAPEWDILFLMLERRNLLLVMTLYTLMYT